MITVAIYRDTQLADVAFICGIDVINECFYCVGNSS